MRFDRFISLLTLCLLLFSCATPEEERIENDKKRIIQELKEEVEVGRAISAKVIGHFGIDDIPDSTLKYLNLLGRVIAEQGGRPEVTFRFSVLKSDKVNAYAAPGGYIFLTHGLLKAVKNEDELACVLGHEVTHVTRKHLIDDIRPKREVTAADTFSKFLSGGKSDVGKALSGMVAAGVKKLLETGWEQSKEIEADQFGSLYAFSAGYSPEACRIFLGRLISKSPSENTASKSHPALQERIQNLLKFQKENGIVLALTNNLKREERFTKAMNELSEGKEPIQ